MSPRGPRKAKAVAVAPGEPWPYFQQLLAWGLRESLADMEPRLLALKQEPEPYVRRLYDDFEFFLCEVWALAGLPEPSIVQRDIARWLQKGPTRRIIKGFRGVSKTWITIAYILWRLFRDPNERVLLVSETITHSRKSLLQARSWMGQVPFLGFLRPRPPTLDRTWRDERDQFDVGPSKIDRVASVSAMGITGQLTGGRSSLIVADDVETSGNSLTRDQRLALRERIKELENILLPEGQVIYLGTPHHEETLYDELPARGYSMRTWPARYPPKDLDIRCVSPMLLGRLKAGKNKIGDPTWPERFSDEVLVAKELGVSDGDDDSPGGRSNFEMQFMLISGLNRSDRYPLKLSDLIVFAVHRDKAPATIAWGEKTDHSTTINDIPCPGLGNDRFLAPIMIDDLWLPYSGTYAWIDPAGGGKDEMSWAIVAQLHGYLFAKMVDGVRGGATPENLNRIVLDLRKHRATRLFIETNFGGEMLIQLIRPVIARHAIRPDAGNPEYPRGWNCSVEGVHSAGQKELRILGNLEPVMNQHRLVVSREVAQDQTLGYQMTRLTRQRACLEHDDRVEALAACVGQWKDVLDQDEALAVARIHDEQYLEIQKRYLKLLGQKAVKAPNWIQHRN